MHIRTIVAAHVAACLWLSIVEEPAVRAWTGQEDIRAAIERIRVLDPVVRSAFDRGMSQSATFVRLVARLQHSDVIVYLVQGPCPNHVVGCVALVDRQREWRYVRINLVLLRGAEPTALKASQERLVAQIGHELQHAIEIASEPSIVDTRSLERAYTRNGAYQKTFGYETDDAAKVEADVLKELARAHSSAGASSGGRGKARPR